MVFLVLLEVVLAVHFVQQFAFLILFVLLLFLVLVRSISFPQRPQLVVPLKNLRVYIQMRL